MNDFSSIETLDFSVFYMEHELRLFPNWMLRYFETLSPNEQWTYFLSYRSLSTLMYSEDYLMDQLKWILKTPGFDLTYDFYVQLMFDPEADCQELFKPGGFESLDEQFSLRFTEDYADCFLSEETTEVPAWESDDLEDTLLF